MLMALALAMTATTGAQSIERFSDREAAQSGLIAERIERPRNVDGAVFAARLVDAEGAKSWSASKMMAGVTAHSRIAYRARYAADGREVVVYYDPRTSSRSSGRVCRVSRPRGGLTNVHYRAVQWCFATFGVTLPASRVPAVYDATVRESAERYIGETLGLKSHKAVSVDLNGDGVPEVLVFASDPQRCGSGGCQLFILTEQGDSYRVVTKVSVARLPVRVLSTRSNGWSDLGVQVGGGGIRQGFQSRLRFDGKRYPGNPTVAPVVAAGAVEGRIVLQ